MSRYIRLLQLSTFSEEKLHILQSKKVLLVGVGGVGQYVATSLVTNGVTQLTIVDFDKVELSNLNRQILLNEDDIGKKKVEVVKKELEKKNSTAEIKALEMKVTKENVDQLVQGYDVVIDAVDNWETKLVLGESCARHKIPFLHIGVDGNRGQYCLFETKSLLDVFGLDIKKEPRDGVTGPMVGVIASMAALHLLKYLVGDSPSDTLYYFDSQNEKFGSTKI